MDKDVKSIINEFIAQVYSEQWDVVNRMCTDLLEFILAKNINDDLASLLLLLNEASAYLNFKNELLLKELSLRVIRTSKEEVTADSCVESDKPKTDKYGEIKIENLTRAEIQNRLSTCQIHPYDLPRVPGEVYNVCHRNGDDSPEYYVTYTVNDDGSITDDLGDEEIGENLELGLNRLFSNVVREEEKKLADE